MAAVASPFKFTYGSQAVGGDSGTFPLDGSHGFMVNHDELTFRFTVVVVATSYADLQNQSETLLAAFSKRDQTLKIDLDNIDDAGGSSEWEYTIGEEILNSQAEIEKTGEETDNGFSRSYDVRVTAGRASQDVVDSGAHVNKYTGLREISFDTTYEPSQRRRIMMQGTYTSTPAQTSPSRSAQNATENYEDEDTGADAEQTAYLSTLTGTFEMVHETAQRDRNNHEVTFSRTFLEQLVDQTSGTRDAAHVRDHSFSFSEEIDQPGDATKGIYRLRKVHGRYECAVDVVAIAANSKTIYDVFETEIKPHIISLFQAEFTPAQFCVDGREVVYDRAQSRLHVSMGFLYKKAGGSQVVEVSTRVIDVTVETPTFTPVHENNRFAMERDVGFATRIKTTENVTTTIGEDPTSGGNNRRGGSSSVGVGPGAGPRPKSKGGKGGGGSPKNKSRNRGGGTDSGGGTWIEIEDYQETATEVVGDPDHSQLTLTHTITRKVEQYYENPSGRAKVSF